MTPQDLNLELIREASFNDFDGPAIADDLIAHPDLWSAVLMDRRGIDDVDLIKLRDLEEGYWNVDTLYILAKPGKRAELDALADDWGMDERSWITGRDAALALGGGRPGQEILKLWWD